MLCVVDNVSLTASLVLTISTPCATTHLLPLFASSRIPLPVSSCPEQVVRGTREALLNRTEVLVKWTGLPYDACTWEDPSKEPLRSRPELVTALERFEAMAVDTEAKREAIFARATAAAAKSAAKSSAAAAATAAAAAAATKAAAGSDDADVTEVSKEGEGGGGGGVNEPDLPTDGKQGDKPASEGPSDDGKRRRSGGTTKADAQFAARVAQLASASYVPRSVRDLSEQPGDLRGGALFPHQMEALNWLRRAWAARRNVILADEMGLGKTVSATSFLSSVKFEFGAPGPCMVLVPLSTMPNWAAEFALWAPHLNAVEYHGSAAARANIRAYEFYAGQDEVAAATQAGKPGSGQAKSVVAREGGGGAATSGSGNGSGNGSGGGGKKALKFHVLLTTFEMIIVDTGLLRSIPWEVLIVDEGHRLKNSESKLFSLLNTFSFQHRVLLTGTPLQNNIGEMYTLLSFLHPEEFPSLVAFRERFAAMGSDEQVAEVQRMVAPHMLRRLKRDAMKNIPPKEERVVCVDLTTQQVREGGVTLCRVQDIVDTVWKSRGVLRGLVAIYLHLSHLPSSTSSTRLPSRAHPHPRPPLTPLSLPPLPRPPSPAPVFSVFIARRTSTARSSPATTTCSATQAAGRWASSRCSTLWCSSGRYAGGEEGGGLGRWCLVEQCQVTGWMGAISPGSTS